MGSASLTHPTALNTMAASNLTVGVAAPFAASFFYGVASLPSGVARRFILSKRGPHLDAGLSSRERFGTPGSRIKMRATLAFLKKRTKKLLLVFGVTTASQVSALAGAFMLGSAAFGQTPMPPPLLRNDRGEIDEPINFEVAFSMTLAWDLCGDPHHGELARQALTQQFNTCPFSAKAKAEFKTFLVVTMPEILARYKRIGPGDACNGMNVGTSDPMLDQYERDGHSIPLSWRLRCDQPLAPP